MPTNTGNKQTKAEKRRAARKAKRAAARNAANAAPRKTTPNQLAVIRNVKKANPNHDFSYRNRDMGMALTRFMMMPLDGPVMRLPTRDAPPVAVSTMRYLNRFTEYINTPYKVFGESTFMACLYGQPGLMYADGPHFPPPNFDYLLPLSFAINPVVSPVIATPDPHAWLTPPLDWVNLDPDIELNQSWPVELMKIPAAWQDASSYPEYQPILEHEGKRYVFLQAEDSLAFTITTVGTYSDFVDTTFGFTYLSPTGPTFLKEYAISVSSGTNTYSIPDIRAWIDVFMRPEFGIWVNVTLKTLTRRSTASGGFSRMALAVAVKTLKDSTKPRLRLNYMKDLVTAPMMAKELRRTAATLLVSNYSSEYVAQGGIKAARMLPGVPGNPSSTEFADARDLFTGHAKTGVYTYSEFAQEDEAFHHHLTGLNGPLCRLQTTPYSLITISNANWMTAPNTYQLICDSAVEFKTTSQLFTPAVSMLSCHDLDMARKINNSTKWFYENPSHMEQIWKYVQKAWNTLRTHSTKIGAAASIMFPEAAPMIMPISRALQR